MTKSLTAAKKPYSFSEVLYVMDFPLKIMSSCVVHFFSANTNLPTFKSNNTLLNLTHGIAESQ